MKKVILILLALLAIVGCEKKGDGAIPEKADKQERISQRQQEINNFLDRFGSISDEQQMQLAKSKDACKHYVIINLDKITVNQAAWLADNSDFILDTPTGLDAAHASPTTAHTTRFFNVSKFVKDKHDDTKEQLAQWLQDNQNYICFEATDAYIECVHLVQEQMTYMYTEQPLDDHKSFEDIVNAIKLTDTAFDYKKDHYKYFVRFSFDTAGKVIIQPRRSFVPDGSYFSVALLRQAMNKCGDGMKTDFEFRRIRVANELRTFFSVKNSDGTYFYDFSQIPNGVLKPGQDLLNAFSPL